MAGFLLRNTFQHPFPLFAMHLWDTTSLVGDSVANYVSAVKTRLALFSTVPLPESPVLTKLLAGLRAQPRVRAHRDPAPAQLVANLVSDPALDLGVRTVVSILWHATLRVGSLTGDRVQSFDNDYALLRRDVIFHGGWVGLRVKSFKSDKLNRGDVVWLAPTNAPGCPVELFMRYWSASSTFDPDSPLFRRLSDGGIITRRAVAWAIRLHARSMGLDPTYFSAHSLRVGSATQLASAGISLQDILLQGRWVRTDSALRYLRQSLPRFERILRALSLESCFDSPAGVPSRIPRAPRVFPLPARVRA